QVVFAVIAESSTNEPSRLVAASIGVAMPADPTHHGYISEHHSYGQNEVTSGEYAEDLAASMLATVLGVPFEPGTAWDERREQWLLSGEIVRTMNVTSTAEWRDDGRWTTGVSAGCCCALRRGSGGSAGPSSSCSDCICWASCGRHSSCGTGVWISTTSPSGTSAART